MTPAGQVTWNKLYEVYKDIYNTTPTHPETPTPPSETNPSFPGTLLQIGSRGSEVILMQQSLNVISTIYTAIPKLSEDGIFGVQTDAAVRAFQRQFGLTVDGAIGPITWDRIIAERNRIIGVSAGPPFPGTSLRIGSSGSNIMLMQEYLNAIGQVYTAIPQLVADGVFGTRTQNAVMAFQRQFGLTVDGIIGRNTWNSIAAEYNRISSNQMIARMMVMTRMIMGIY